MVKKNKFTVYVLVLAAAYFLGSLMISSYGWSILDGKDRTAALNDYWGEQLDLEVTPFKIGPHYWEGESLYLYGQDGFLQRASWKNGQFDGLSNYRELPKELVGSPRVIHKNGLLATDRQVYHWDEVNRGWVKVIERFNPWHTNSEYV